ncbi:uncharacterized protein LOC124420534 [Lucilia cuprina]|uniref:uncharacterized protein LOC124420534 n=1 Tax=Lucilia cuprina TaxID=7375 RepID=UPI001F06D536|nr:uncharacterized protein LOC124420534 [Lucilia cuprina]
MKKYRVKKLPAKCNILGLSYRSISILIASVLIIQDVCYIISFMLKTKISCHIFNNGLYSLVIQFGDDYWSLAGLLIAILCLVTNAALLVGSIWLVKSLILMWYVGGIIQFVYLLSFQSFCLSTKSCNNHCTMDQEASKYYHWGFGWSLFITLYFYVTFIFKIQLFYEYVKYLKRPRLTTFSGNEMFNRSSFFRRSSSLNI